MKNVRKFRPGDLVRPAHRSAGVPVGEWVGLIVGHKKMISEKQRGLMTYLLVDIPGSQRLAAIHPSMLELVQEADTK